MAGNQEGNAISLAYDGSIGEAFYQPEPFLASEKIAVLRLNEKWNQTLNPHIAFFLIGLIRKEKFRYNYGLKWSINSRLLSSIIKLPVTQSGNPDWTYMESYIKKLPHSPTAISSTTPSGNTVSPPNKSGIKPRVQV